RAGRSPSTLQAEIRATPEARIKRDISSIHQRILGRDLDNTQLQYYYGEVAAGRRTLAALQEEFQRQANNQARPTPTPTTPQPTIAPSPTPVPTTPGDLIPPRPNSPVATIGNAYYVVVPGGNLTEISQRMVQLGAPAGNVQARQQPRGPHVALGPFDDRRLANQWTTYLRGNGLDARVYYGQ
ncbi:MAG: hypothetical protein NZ772_18605, partial [Cyanobacteria bacterium]|nr:hypothetical protein [Cyanobacteriota bacterium]MDW8203264.1 hypothetical protein [Cyanobacteriota bacterium SKYGB_h_bin112]